MYAAQAALATQYQGKYLQSHHALLSAPRLAQTEQVDDALRRSGIDMSELKNDLINHRAAIDALLARNHAEALALKLRGTPGKGPADRCRSRPAQSIVAPPWSRLTGLPAN